MKLKFIVVIVTLFLGLNMNCQNSPKIVSANLAESIKEGQLIYNEFCISCHMAYGEGAGAIFPPLANSDFLKTKQIESIKAVKYGMSGEILVNGKTYNSVMSPLGLSDQEVADVMNFINNSWGNDYGEFYSKSDISKIKPN